MEAHVAFLLALLGEPGDGFSRLVYADWLDEQGGARGEFLRVQAAIARLGDDDPRLPALAGRERALFAAQRGAWLDLRERLAPHPEARRCLDERILGPAERDPVGFHCPACGGTDCSRWKATHPLLLHWVLNPGLAVNELVLGQRLPRTVYTCTACPRAHAPRQYTRCPVCRRFQPLAHWGETGGHWAGWFCPECGTAIPLLRNAVAGAAVGVGRLAARGVSSIARGLRFLGTGKKPE